MNIFSESMYRSELAEYYDAMRAYRDYTMEASFADSLIRQACPQARSVLDICCGTGEHALRMAGHGYEVTGIDRSADMLNIAATKAKTAGRSIDFIQADADGSGLESTFDAAYCLGYSFLYMVTHEKARAFLSTVYERLKSGGVFIVDFINGWSLIDTFSRDKVTYEFEDATIFQFEQATLDRENRVKHIEFQYLIDNHEGYVRTVYADEHLRIYFEDEVRLLMEFCGFGDIRSYADYDLTEEKADLPGIVLLSGRKA